MDSSRYRIEPFVAFVEADGVQGDRIVLKLRIPSHRAGQVSRLCAARGWHQLRFYRGAFARGLRDACDNAHRPSAHREAYQEAAGDARQRGPQPTHAGLVEPEPAQHGLLASAAQEQVQAGEAIARPREREQHGATLPVPGPEAGRNQRQQLS